MRTLLLTAFLLIAQMANAQLSLPVTFDVATTNYGLTDFGGNASSIVADPTNPDNKVVRSVKSAGAELWAGTTVGGFIGFGTKIPFTLTATKMSARVWSPDAGIKVRLKVEQAGVPTVSVETEATTTVAGGWQTLVFDFSNHATGTAPLNIANSYNLASIFFNFGVTGAVAGEKVYYWDDLAFGAGAAAPSGPTFPVTVEDAGIDWAAIVTGFDGGALTRVANPSKSGINTSNFVLQMVKGAGQPWAGAFFPMAADINLQQSTEFKLKVWSPRAGAKLLFKLENNDNAGQNFEQERTIDVANQWVELTYDFSVANRTNMYRKVVLIFDLGTVGDGGPNFTFYVDDITQTAAAPPPPPPPITLPISVEEANIPWAAMITNFDGGSLTRVENPDKSGLNTSNNVLKMVKNTGAPWGGSFFNLGGPINFATSKQFKALVWSPRADAKMLLKVENSANPAQNFEKEVVIGTANAWTEVTFDYTDINTANSYDRIVLIFDLGTVGDGSANFTFYVDNITNGTPVTPPAPVLAFPVTAEEAGIDWATLFTGFDGGVLTREANPDKSGLNTSNNVLKMVKNAGQPWGGAFFPMSANFDLSGGKTVFKVWVWSPRVGAKMLFKLENESNGAINAEREQTIGVANAWTELTFDFSGTSTTNSYRKVVLIFDLGTPGDGSANYTFYVDNIRQLTAETPPPPPTGVLAFPVTAEEANIDWATLVTNFDGGVLTREANPNKSGLNTSNNVLKMVKNAGQPWGGSFFPMSANFDLSSGKTIFKVLVWSPRVGAKMLFKLENESNGGINVEREQTINVANAWTELTFDFAGTSTTNSYRKVVMIFDLGTMGDGSSNYTFYVDNIRQLTAETPPPPPMVFPVSFEEAEMPWATMFTGFDGGVLSRVQNPDKSGMNTSNHVARMVKNTGAPWGGAWFRMSEPIDMTNKTFKVKVWSPRADAKLLFKLENDTNGGINVELERPIGVANQWTEVSFDMSHGNPTNIYQKVVLIFDLGTPGDGSSNFTFYLDDITNTTSTSVDRDDLDSPAGFSLSQNYPNPFNPSTMISYNLIESGMTRLTVFDMLGREVAVLVDQNQAAGTYQVSFDASGLPTGMYLYRLQSGTRSLTGKMLLVK
jgi:hypothetical protein